MSNFLLDAILASEGLSDAERAQVDAALPALEEMVTLINVNMPFLQKMLQLWATIGPAAQMVSQHLAAGGTAK